MTVSHDPPENEASDFVTHAYDGETLASHAVIGAIADLEGTTPAAVHTELEIVLYDHIDPEQLDALLESGDGSGELVVSFRIDERDTYSVEIVDGESVSVTRTA